MNFAPRIRKVYLVVVFTLVLGGLGLRGTAHLLGYYLQKEAVPLRREFASIPTTLGSWKRVGQDHIDSEDVLAELGTRLYLTRTYARDGDPRLGAIQLHIAYYTGMIDAVPHIPERCMYAAGLNPIAPPQVVDLGVRYVGEPDPSAALNRTTSLPYAYRTVTEPVTGEISRVAMPQGQVELTLTRFQNPSNPRVEVDVGYFFIANGRLTPSTWGVRSLAFNLTDRHAYYCKVQLGMTNPIGEIDTLEIYRKDTADFVEHLMPYLMRALPDWPEVERSEEAADTRSNG